MKKYTAEELKEILKLHKKWLNDEDGGIYANLSFADLSFADLSSANLSFADLSSSNLSFADLSSSDLSFADLSFADLSSANLSFADLSSSNLSSSNLSFADLSSANLSFADLSSSNLSSSNLSFADLRSSNLSYAIGEMRSLRSFQIEKYMVSYTDSILNIGCQSHTIEEWNNFDDEQISNMDSGALGWWVKWKPIIMQIIEMSPAKPTGYKEAQDENKN